MILSLDENSFLGLDQVQDNGKEFSIIAGGEVFVSKDHQVLVWHKKSPRPIAWKDLGNTMNLVRLVTDTISSLNKETDLENKDFRTSMYQVLARYSSYDEKSNQTYSYVPKLSGKKLQQTLESFEGFLQKKEITLLDKDKGWLQVPSSKSSAPLTTNHVLAEFFALYLLYGKATIQSGELRALKIQVPVLEHQILDYLEIILQKLRKSFFVINYDYNSDHQTATLSSSDYDLLAYLQILLGDEKLLLSNKVLEIKHEILTTYTLPDSLTSLRWKLYEVKR